MTRNRSSFSGIYSTFFQTFGLCLILNSTIFSSETSPQQAFMLKRIAEYWKEGDSTLAKSQILSFLKKYPESDSLDTLYAMLGDIYIQERNFESANFYYEKITSEEISSKTIFNKILCLYQLHRTDEVIFQITKTIANPIQNQDTETLKFLLAESLVIKAKTTDNDRDKEILLHEALPLYHSLLESKYAEHSLIPAAEIAASLNKFQEACRYYTSYLQLNPHQNETILFKMGILQENFKPLEAAKTYSKLYKLKGPYSEQAAFKQLKLLFKDKNYKDLLLNQEEAMKHISTKDLPMAHYWIGKSLLNLEDFVQAKNHLIVTLSSNSLSIDDQKIVLSNLITCAGKTKDITLLNSLIEKWEILDKKDPSLADAYLLKFQLLNISDKKSACDALEKIKTEHPLFPGRESILFNLAGLQYKLELWESAANTIEDLVREFPETKFANLSQRMKLNCLIEDVNYATAESRRIKKFALAKYLEEILPNKKAFSNAELNNYHFVYCKTLSEIERYEEALYEIQNFIDRNIDPDNLSQAYMLMSEIYSQNDEDVLLFISAAQKALSYTTDIEDKNFLHIKLFDAYLTHAMNSSVQEKQDLLDKAATHLHSSFLCGNKIKKENAYWLSNHFYQKLEKHQYKNASHAETLIENGISIIEHILDIKDYPPSANVRSNPTLAEVEMLKLADLLGKKGLLNEKMDVLEVLVYQQKNYTEVHWKYPRKALIELAGTYSALGLFQDAIDTFDHLITSAELTSSYVGNVAIIEKCRLRYNLLEAAVFDNDSPELLSILDDLKALEIRKKLYSEPTHLEAGLTYIDLKTAHMLKDTQVEKQHHLLLLLRANFSDSNDPALQEYLSENTSYPEKQEVYKYYLKYIDSLIYLKKAEICLIEKKPSEAPALIRNAMVGFRELADGKNLPLDLSKRVHSKLEAMEKKL